MKIASYKDYEAERRLHEHERDIATVLCGIDNPDFHFATSVAEYRDDTIAIELWPGAFHATQAQAQRIIRDINKAFRIKNHKDGNASRRWVRGLYSNYPSFTRFVNGERYHLRFTVWDCLLPAQCKVVAKTVKAKQYEIVCS